MPLPKRRHSKTRRDKRRTHYKLTPPAIVSCPSCGAPTVAHTACKSCGQYRRRLVIPESKRTRQE
ncbi:MAG: 50S ribosomal protein L32 [Armatimonadetes bacterium]|nr:50S ribosomal protein L32 [Armatimonadota bacterium]